MCSEQQPYEEYFKVLLTAGKANGKPIRLPRDVDAVRYIAIGPDSVYDSVTVVVGGRELLVSRGCPFLGYVPLGQQGQRQALVFRQNPGRTPGLGSDDLERYGAQIHIANFIPAVIPHHRAPLHKTGARNATTDSLATVFRVGVWGREKIVIAAHNQGANGVTYVVTGYVHDNVGITIESYDLTSLTVQGDGDLGANENQFSVLTNEYYDEIEITARSTTTLQASTSTYRLDAYDREG